MLQSSKVRLLLFLLLYLHVFVIYLWILVSSCHNYVRHYLYSLMLPFLDLGSGVWNGCSRDYVYETLTVDILKFLIFDWLDLNRSRFLRTGADIFYLDQWFHNRCNNVTSTRSGSDLWMLKDLDTSFVDSGLDRQRNWFLLYYSCTLTKRIARYLWLYHSSLYVVLDDESA